jgi:hypothetical protein
MKYYIAKNFAFYEIMRSAAVTELLLVAVVGGEETS